MAAANAPRMARGLREALIEQVQRRPVLYDTRRDDHRETELRDRAWLDIADTLHINSEVLKREWKILRDSLRQALNKRARRAPGPAPRWYFEAKMAFLLPHMTKRAVMSLDGDEDESPARPAGDPADPADAADPADRARPAAGGGAAGGGAAGGGAAGGGAAGGRASDDGLELFFASVCACARALPRPRQARLKRQVLDALLQAEAEAEDD